MSLERRQYAQRKESPPVVQNTPERLYEWDEEAQHAASAQAREAALRDPDAALLLAEQLTFQPMPEATSAYNPIAIYAALARSSVNLKPHECDAMDYSRFFGLVRELTLLDEREQRELDRMKHESAVPPSQVAAQYPHVLRDDE